MKAWRFGVGMLALGEQIVLVFCEGVFLKIQSHRSGDMCLLVDSRYMNR